MPVAPPLISTYSAPTVTHGERVACLYRDRDCIVTTLSNAPIPWPRVRSLEGNGGGSGLWVNDELVRAIRTESAAALGYWFGVTAGVVWKWRKTFGVGGHGTTTGSKRAIRAAAKLGAEAMKAKDWTDADRRARARRSKRLQLKPTGRWTSRGWTPAQLTLVGTDHDEAIAHAIGRTRGAVTAKRTELKRPAYSGWPGGAPGWCPEDVALLGTGTDAAVAQKTGRTRAAVSAKRGHLKVPPFRPSWTEGEVELLGTDHDAVLAKTLGRTRTAVALQRTARKIPAFSGWVGGGRAWGAEEVALLGTDFDEVVAARIGRTVSAVEQKREGLRIAPFRDRRHG